MANEMLRLLRPHQWLKNLLVFAPLLFSGRSEIALLWESITMFISFCLGASAAYSLNDVIDYKRDAAHPEKRNRPVASGKIPVRIALLMSLMLAAGSLAIAATSNVTSLALMAIYLVVQLGYSFFIKHVAILDLLTLSSMYIIRVLGGVSATQIEPSPWILTTTWLLALTLAIGKRYLELLATPLTASTQRPVLGAYSPKYLEHLLSATGMAALICYLLWCSENVTTGRFGTIVIFPSCLLVAFGVLRYELLVFRNEFREDPTIGILSDKPLLGAILAFSLYHGLVRYL